MTTTTHTSSLPFIRFFFVLRKQNKRKKTPASHGYFVAVNNNWRPL